MSITADCHAGLPDVVRRGGVDVSAPAEPYASLHLDRPSAADMTVHGDEFIQFFKAASIPLWMVLAAAKPASVFRRRQFAGMTADLSAHKAAFMLGDHLRLPQGEKTWTVTPVEPVRHLTFRSAVEDRWYIINGDCRAGFTVLRFAEGVDVTSDRLHLPFARVHWFASAQDLLRWLHDLVSEQRPDGPWPLREDISMRRLSVHLNSLYATGGLRSVHAVRSDQRCSYRDLSYLTGRLREIDPALPTDHMTVAQMRAAVARRASSRCEIRVSGMFTSRPDPLDPPLRSDVPVDHDRGRLEQLHVCRLPSGFTHPGLEPVASRLQDELPSLLAYHPLNPYAGPADDSTVKA